MSPVWTAPASYRAYAAGLAVVAAGALDRLTADRIRLTLLAAGLVLAALLVAYRHLTAALLVVLHSLSAGGWANGLMGVLGASESPPQFWPLTPS